MSSLFSTSLLLSLLAISPNPCAQAAESGITSAPTPAKLQVRLYDYARLSPAMIKWAAEDAKEVLSKAGISTRWLDCSMSLSDEELDPSCRVASGPTVVVLKILPREMAERFTVPEGSFGFAMLPDKARGFGSQAVVFYHRVNELAADMDSYRSVALGHILAHEIGHLLLGSGSHSSQGIMKATWQNADMEKAIRGKMRFTPKQAKRMRAQMLDRIHALGTVPCEADLRPTITVRVFNYAGVAERIVAAAKEQAGKVLRKVNVETVWVECPTSLAELRTNMACRGRPTATELVIRIIPRSQNPRYPLGFAALPTEKGKVASQAGVFFEAAEELAAGHPTSTAQMLGYILTHEIGHLLLGEGGHSEKGIMRTPWLKQEMDDAARGWLGFTAKQAKRMKADLLARARLAATSASLSLQQYIPQRDSHL